MGMTLAVTAAVWGLASEPALAQEAGEHMQQAQHSAPMLLYQLAEGGPDFWSNVVRYGRYFVTVMLGTGYVMVQV
jgi:hypothetical protein